MFLKCLGILSDIMGHSGKKGLFITTKRPGKALG